MKMQTGKDTKLIGNPEETLQQPKRPRSPQSAWSVSTQR